MSEVQTEVDSVESAASEQRLGTVKWFNDAKGFGFIAQDEGPDLFVHYRAIVGKGHLTLNDGQRVSFDVIPGEKGPQAENVLVVE